MQNLYRPSLFRMTLIFPAAVMLGLFAACSSSSPPMPQQEFFDTGASPFSRAFEAPSAAACEAARRALLSQGYLATATRPDTIDATRDFQPSSDKHITVEFHVVCTPGDDPENSTIVYANAVQSGYALKKSDTSASVGFSVLGSVSLPIRSNSDSMVKVSSETIQSGPFYTQFFEYVAHYLHKPPKAIPVPPASIKTTQLPGSPAAVAAPAASAPDAAATSPTTATPQQTTPATTTAPATTATAAAATQSAPAANGANTAAAAAPSPLPATLVGPANAAPAVQPTTGATPAVGVPAAATQ